MPIHAEHVRERQRDHRVVFVGEVDDLADRLLGRREVEEVALDVRDLRARNEIAVNILDGQAV